MSIAMWLATVFLLTKFTLILMACPSGSNLGTNGLCYQPFTIKTTWYQGESTCVSNGGHLASVKDAFLNSFLTGLGEFPFNHTQFWLGGTTNFLGGNWSWTDFTPFSYNNWAIGNNNYSLGYCAVQRIADGKWLSSDCSQQNYFICEYPLNQAQTCSCPTYQPPVTSVTPPPGKNCPNGDWYYSSVSSKCYYFYIGDITWNKSYTSCQNLYNGTSLAIIHSSNENNAIINIFNSQHPNPTVTGGDYYWLWIGLRLVNGNYTWVDGSLLDFSDFYTPPSASCVHMDPGTVLENYDNNHTWYGDDCSTSGRPNLGYICELRI